VAAAVTVFMPIVWARSNSSSDASEHSEESDICLLTDSDGSYIRDDCRLTGAIDFHYK